MSLAQLNANHLREALLFAATRFQKEEPRLCSLDAAIGDGDHGITMRVGFDAIASSLQELAPTAGIDEVLQNAGTAFMSATGGAIGIIFGRMFSATGRALKGQTALDAAQYLAMLRAMETAVANAGKAHPGDRTALDAIHAAANVPAQPDLLSTMQATAAAAENAAAQTAQMLCKVGRASKLGERVLGHPDPGATSFGLLLRAWADWAATQS